jgi:tRNA nucleotidyltransferase (CCA-adding enzyme)
VEKSWIELLSGARLWRELRLMLDGESPVACLARLDELQILPHIDPALALPPPQRDLLARAAEARIELAETHPDALGRAWPLYLAILFDGLDPDVARRIGVRLALSPRTIHELLTGLSATEEARRRLCAGEEVQPSVVTMALRPLSAELLPLLLALCAQSPGRRLVHAYLSTWRHVRPALTGDDLKRLGVPQGSLIGRALAQVLAAKLDGTAPTREAEETLVRSWLAAQE